MQGGCKHQQGYPDHIHLPPRTFLRHSHTFQQIIKSHSRTELREVSSVLTRGLGGSACVKGNKIVLSPNYT